MKILEELRGTAGTGEWVGVDLDQTAARYNGWLGSDHVGEPVPEIIDLIKAYLEAKIEVRIFTARAGVPEQVPAVERWCEKHIGQKLPVTNVKDFGMRILYDDRAVQIIPNKGISLEEYLIQSGWIRPDNLEIVSDLVARGKW